MRMIESIEGIQGQQVSRAGPEFIGPTYSLRCSSFFWFDQFHIKDPLR